MSSFVSPEAIAIEVAAGTADILKTPGPNTALVSLLSADMAAFISVRESLSL